VVAGACGSVLHTFVAIVAPAAADSAAPDGAAVAARPMMPAGLRERLRHQSRFGLMPPEREPAR
jgi:hypothetical protein